MNSKEILKQIREESDDLDREVKMSRKDFLFSLWMASRLPESEIVEWPTSVCLLCLFTIHLSELLHP